MTYAEALHELRRRGLAALILPDNLGVAIMDPGMPPWNVTRSALGHGLTIEDATRKTIERLDHESR